MNMERREIDFGARADYALGELANDMGAEKIMEQGKWKLRKAGVEATVEMSGTNAVTYEVKNIDSGKVIEKGMLDGIEELQDRLYKIMHQGIEENFGGVGDVSEASVENPVDQSVSDAIAGARAGKRRERAEAVVRAQGRMNTSRTHVSGNVPTQIGRLDTPTKADESQTRLGVEPAVTRDLPYDEQPTQTGEDEMAA